MPKPTSSKLVELPFRSHFERPFEEALIPLPWYSQLLKGAEDHRNDCGPACVCMAFNYLGLAPGVSINQLSKESDPPDDGTTAQDLVDLARAYGASAKVHRLSLDELPESPAILLVRYCGFDRDKVENKRYWDLSASNPEYRHWMWWLGNEEDQGEMKSVWNDPLYTTAQGKQVKHDLTELEKAFAPYGHSYPARIAVTFDNIKNPEAFSRNAIGIDVSHYRPTVDWQRVKDAGFSFAYIKATEGTTFTDDLFDRHWQGARKVSILRGAYHLFHPTEDAHQQAWRFVNVVGARPALKNTYFFAQNSPPSVGWGNSGEVPHLLGPF